MAFLHLSLGRQTATSGAFSTDGFGWLGLNPAGVCLNLVTTSYLNEAYRSSSLFPYTSLPYPFCCWTCFPIRLLVLALYSPRSLGRLDLCATSGASMGERTYHDAISNTKLLAAMPCDLNLSSAYAAVSFFLAIGARVLLPFGRPAWFRAPAHVLACVLLVVGRQK